MQSEFKMTKKMKQHFLEFGKNTSVKGIGKVIKSDRSFLKIIWLFAVLIGGTTAAYQLTIFFIKYFKYETTTKISYCNRCHPPFPDVTVCNINPLSLIANYEDELLQYSDYIDILMEYHWPPLSNFTFFEEELNLKRQEVYEAIDALFSLKGYFMNMDPGESMAVVTTTDEDGLILDCNWFDWLNRPYLNNSRCMDIVRRNAIYTNDYYICNTFHLNESQNDKVKGLEAIVYLNDFSNELMLRYHQNLLGSQASGARILIHSPGTYPEMSKGFNIPPGNEVTVQLKAMKVKRKGDPYSQCTNTEWQEPRSKNVSNDIFPRFKYNNMAASSVCKQEYFLRNCGCYHPSYPITNYILENFPIADYKGCGTFIHLKDEYEERPEIIFPTTTEMMNHTACYLFKKMSTEATQSDIEAGCDFEQSCSEYKYEQSVSTSPWPHEAYQIAFFCKYIAQPTWDLCDYENDTRYDGKFDVYKNISRAAYSFHRPDQEWATEKLKTINLLKRNFIQLKVLFPEMGITEYADTPTVTMEMFFGTMGGMLNLWIGITFFTIIELIDFLYIMISDNIFTKKNQKKVEEANERKTGNDLPCTYS